MAAHSSILAWKNSMDRGAYQATVHGATKSWTWPSARTHTETHTHSMSEGLECVLELLCSDLMSTRWHCKKCFPQCCGFLWESCICYSAKALLTGEPWDLVLLNDWPPSFCSERFVLMHPSIHHCQERNREWFITNDSSLMKITSDYSLKPLCMNFASPTESVPHEKYPSVLRNSSSLLSCINSS